MQIEISITFESHLSRIRVAFESHLSHTRVTFESEVFKKLRIIRKCERERDRLKSTDRQEIVDTRWRDIKRASEAHQPSFD